MSILVAHIELKDSVLFGYIAKLIINGEVVCLMTQKQLAEHGFKVVK